MTVPWLTVAVFLPLAGAVVIALLPSRRTGWPRLVALAVAALDLMAVARVAAAFDPGVSSLQLVESARWAPSLGLSYKLGVDGLSLPMIVLAAVLVLIAVIASWKVDRSPKAFFALLMVLATTMIGVFVALDLILFYVFWEAVLIPMYFLIGRWGSADRQYAALKFFLYTLAASVVMLAGLIAVGLAVGSFDYMAALSTPLAPALQAVVFWAFLFGFAVKVPIVPLHTWLPLAHVEAPTAGSVLLAGILLKMGAYGMLRFMAPLAPVPFKAATTWLIVLGVVNVLWGAYMALAQRDLKRLVAFSSVSHMGFVVIGIALATPASVDGAVFMMVSHGITAAMLFLLVGMIYERTHTREIAGIGGLARTVPVLAGMWLFASLASLGLPGLSGFVSEFVVLGQLFARAELWALVPAAAMVITAAYYLWAYQRIGMGEPLEGQESLADITPREILTVAPLGLAALVLGVAPNIVVGISDGFAKTLMTLVGRGA